MADSSVSAFYRIGIHSKYLIGCEIIAAASGQMRDLDCDVWGRGEQMFEEDSRLLGAVRPVVIYVRPGMNHYRHTVSIRCSENRACTLHVFRNIGIYIGVAEVKFEAGPEGGIFEQRSISRTA